jgi:uncharacterized protein YndB with AHSA1/START domain
VRREILDRLYEHDGQTLTELAAPMEMTRFGAMRHLDVLEEANLIVTRREGREKHHHLNAVPIQEIHDRWLSRYTARWATALTRLKTQLEDGDMTDEGGAGESATEADGGERIYFQIYIRATPEEVWEAITSAEFTRQYFHETNIESDWQVGSPVVYYNDDRSIAVDGEVIEVDRPNRLSYTWHVLYNEDAAKEDPSRVTWELEQVEDACRLRMTHDRFPEGSVVPDGVRDGWPAIISNLKTLLETGRALAVS